MRPPLFNQLDYIDRLDADDYQIASPPEERGARQEFKHEANINTILNRFAVTGVIPPTRQPIYGERDFDLDMHTGFIALHEAQRAFLLLPKELRDKYGSPAGMLNAVHSGDYKKDVAALDTEAADAALDAKEAAANATAQRKADRTAAANLKQHQADAGLVSKIADVIKVMGLKTDT